jgi:hypothetical protein
MLRGLEPSSQGIILAAQASRVAPVAHYLSWAARSPIGRLLLRFFGPNNSQKNYDENYDEERHDPDCLPIH